MAAWDATYVNSLPDSAFAAILPGGKKDKTGRTSPRTLRLFPHHDVSGKVDSGHVDRAASRLEQDNPDVPAASLTAARKHIDAHQGELSAGAESKSTVAPGVERRVVIGDVKLSRRDAGDGTTVDTFEGYAAIFNSRTWIGPPVFGFYEQVAPGAFGRALAENQDVVCLFNHGIDGILGRTSSGTLQLREDDHGLWASDSLPPTQLGRDLAILVERGDVPGMSFSFLPAPGGERWEVLDDGSELRTLTEFSLLADVAPCVSPAYGDTTASVRMAQLGRRNRPTVETDAGEIEVADPEEVREYLSGYYSRLHRSHASLYDLR